MPQFSYVALKGGGRESGRAFAQSIAELKKKLRSQGLFLLKWKAIRVGPRAYLTTVPNDELIAIFDQLEMEVGAGAKVNDAVQSLADDLEPGRAKFVLKTISEGINNAEGVANSFGKFPRIFPVHICQIIELGEKTGSLEIMFKQVADYLRQVNDIQGAIKSATVYPKIVLALASVVFFSFMLFVIPRFASIFTDMNVKLDGPIGAVTKFYIGLSEFVQANLWAVIIGGGLIYFGVPRLVQHSKLRRIKDRVWIRVPRIKRIIQYVAVARYCGSMSTLLHAGMQIKDALLACERVTGNEIYDRAIAEAVRRILAGMGVGQAMEKMNMFPRPASRRIKAGETAGAMEGAFKRVNDFYSQEARRLIERTLRLLEPALIILVVLIAVSIFVGFLSPLVTLMTKIG